jgi:hypothetical protein
VDADVGFVTQGPDKTPRLGAALRHAEDVLLSIVQSALNIETANLHG